MYNGNFLNELLASANATPKRDPDDADVKRRPPLLTPAPRVDVGEHDHRTDSDADFRKHLIAEYGVTP
jgi:hypothetical protein